MSDVWFNIFGIDLARNNLSVCKLKYYKQYFASLKLLKYINLSLLSLNSANSVNHGKIQKCYGCQRYYPSGNKYITSASNTKCIFITTLG